MGDVEGRYVAEGEDRLGRAARPRFPSGGPSRRGKHFSPAEYVLSELRCGEQSQDKPLRQSGHHTSNRHVEDRVGLRGDQTSNRPRSESITALLRLRGRFLIGECLALNRCESNLLMALTNLLL